MRILFITAQLPYGSDEIFFAPEVIELQRLGHEVLIVPRSPSGRIVHDHGLTDMARCEGLFSARVLAKAAAMAATRPLRTLAALWFLRRSRSVQVGVKNLAIMPKALWLAGVAIQWKADHIHCHWAGTTATMAMVASRVSGIPWSLTTHRWDIVENNLLATKAKSATFARFISEDGLRMACELGVDPGDKLRVLHMGVAVPSHIQSRKQPKLAVICAARLTAVKGHRYLLEAWRILQDRNIDAQLWIAGDGELRDELEALSETLGLGSVRFLGNVPHEELVRRYEESAAAVMPSVDLGGGLHEGTPVALIEAMSYGLPVIATRAGGVPELLVPGTGLLVPPADSAALAGALQSVLQDSSLRERLGRSGRERVMQSYDITGVASALVQAMDPQKAPAPQLAAQV